MIIMILNDAEIQTHCCPPDNKVAPLQQITLRRPAWPQYLQRMQHRVKEPPCRSATLVWGALVCMRACDWPCLGRPAAAVTECFLSVPADELLLMNDGCAVFDWLKVPRVATLHSLYNITHIHTHTQSVFCSVGLITLETWLVPITSYPTENLIVTISLLYQGYVTNYIWFNLTGFVQFLKNNYLEHLGSNTTQQQQQQQLYQRPTSAPPCFSIIISIWDTKWGPHQTNVQNNFYNSRHKSLCSLQIAQA